MENTLLNLIPAAYLPEIHLSQYDVGRTITFTLKDGASDYSVPSGASVKVKATKPSGFGFEVACTFNGGTVTLVTTDTMTPENGRFPAELSIVSGNTTIGTSNFIFNIERSPHPEGTIDGDAETIIPELTLLVERIEAAASSVLDMQVVANTLPAGSQATYSYDESLNKATFGIPQGEPGAGAVGTVASAYDATKTYAIGDYAIHNNDLYRCITAITTAEAFTASHWTKIVLADDVTDLKSDLYGYINGINKTITVTETGNNYFPILLLKGVKYAFTNNTTSDCTLNYVFADGTEESITGSLGAGLTRNFTPTRNDAVMLRCYFHQTGTITITNEYVDLDVYPKLYESINTGLLDIGNLIANRYIGTDGGEYAYNGWSATNYIPIAGMDYLLIDSLDNMGWYNCFYDSNKIVISNFLIEKGINRKEIPEGARYIRISGATSLVDGLTIANGVGILEDKVSALEEGAETDMSILALNPDESMIVNAGANYGFHEAGQSNVKKRFSMLVTTDPHGDANAMKRAVAYLNDMPCFDCGITLGDLQGSTFTDNDGTWYTNIIKESNKPWLTIIGNHDVGLGKDPSVTGNLEQVYNKFIAPNMQYAGVTPNGKCYYYKDYADYKIRLICLNAYDVDDNSIVDGEYVVPRYTEYYSQDQIDWLVSLLANTPTDYQVLVATHNIPKNGTKDTSVKFNNKTYAFSPEGTQNGIVADILNAWQNGETLSQTYPCTNTNLDSVTVTADFTSRGDGVLICFLTGHMHVDTVGYITSYPTQDVFTFASTNTGTWQNEWSDLPRADGTKAEDCITALSVDTTNKKIYINRIGSSMSKWFDKREPSVISY